MEQRNGKTGSVSFGSRSLDQGRQQKEVFILDNLSIPMKTDKIYQNILFFVVMPTFLYSLICIAHLPSCDFLSTRSRRSLSKKTSKILGRPIFNQNSRCASLVVFKYDSTVLPLVMNVQESAELLKKAPPLVNLPLNIFFT